MIIRIALAGIAILAVTAGSAPKADWLSRPDPAAIGRCLNLLGKDAVEARIILTCVTTTDGPVKQCKVTASTQPDDPRYEKAALCASETFRMRAVDAEGKTVPGAQVNIPFRLASPDQDPSK